MVFSGFLVLISRWGASHHRVSWWAGSTTCRPPSVRIYKWKWWGIWCIIPSKKRWLEGTASAVDVKWVEYRRLSISQNCWNWRGQHHRRHHRWCSSSTSGTPTPCYRIFPWQQLSWASDCGCSRPNMNIGSVFDRCTRTEQNMVQWRRWCDLCLWRGAWYRFWLCGGARCGLWLSSGAWWGFLGCGGGPLGDSSL